jgi:hypothetical protein
MMEGDLPGRAEKLVAEWAAQHQAEVPPMWNTQDFKQLPGLEFNSVRAGLGIAPSEFRWSSARAHEGGRTMVWCVLRRS